MLFSVKLEKFNYHIPQKWFTTMITVLFVWDKLNQLELFVNEVNVKDYFNER